jgi:hypothetical protein
MSPEPQATKTREGIVVFMIRSDAQCAECGEELGKGRWIRLENQQPLCLSCADLDHLEYLASGDAALTRRASKNSPLRAVVVRWSTARKHYERQGILVTGQALSQAEKECFADAELRQRQRERAADRREKTDDQFVRAVTDALVAQFPGCPASEAAGIAEWTCERRSGRVGRSAAAKDLDPQALTLAVIAHIRHQHTRYDELLMRDGDRRAAREAVRSEIERMLERWR